MLLANANKYALLPYGNTCIWNIALGNPNAATPSSKNGNIILYSHRLAEFPKILRCSAGTSNNA